MKMRFTLFVFVIALLLHSIDARGVCFVSTKSSTRRSVLDVQPTTTQVGCTLICLNNTNCQACVFNATVNRCVLLSAPDTTATDRCPVPYTYLVRTTSNCPVLPAFNVDLDYSPGACSTSSDVASTPVVAASPVCGNFTTGNRKIVFDAILHDGTHVILESYSASYVQWDAELGSWYFSLKSTTYYFKSGTCVRPPATQSGSCVCTPFDVETPLSGYSNPTPVAIDTFPVCPGMVQQHYYRVRGTGGVTKEILNANGRSVYCAMGIWMLLIDTPTFYNQYAILAATCVTANSG